MLTFCILSVEKSADDSDMSPALRKHWLESKYTAVHKGPSGRKGFIHTFFNLDSQ